MKKHIYTVIVLLGAFLFASCLKDYEDINKNPLFPDDKMKSYDGVAGGSYFISFEKMVIPTRSAEGEGTDLPNRYQVAINLAGDNWCGYMSPMNNKWNNGTNFTTYYMVDGWVSYAFGTYYTQIVNPWMQIKDQTHIKKVEKGKVSYEKKALPDQAIFSVAQIIKIMGLHRATDTYGPLPYSEVGSGDLKIAYDHQELIYKSFFKELQEAVETLQEIRNKGTEIIDALADFDAVYFGQVEKWMKLANSLMLRLALRVRYVDQDLSQQWATRAVTNPAGVMTSEADAAMLNNSGGHNFLNSIQLLWKEYDDCRMGATIYCYLKGYDDPRGSAYFTKFEKDPDAFQLKGVRSGIPMSENSDQYKNYSIPNIFNETPVYWFKASEVSFLKAEAALYHLIPGSAKDFYEEGIRTSFRENNVKVGDYLQNRATPSDYYDKVMPGYNAGRPSTVSVRWEDAQNDEQRLEKIITQKYLAIYPDGQEAWTEWRRTGYPRQIPVYVNSTDATHGNVVDSDGYKYGVRRIIFPRAEYEGINAENVKKAAGLLSSGVDDCNARLWWDANPALN